MNDRLLRNLAHHWLSRRLDLRHGKGRHWSALVIEDVCWSDFKVWCILRVEELRALEVLEMSIVKHMLVVPLTLKLRSSSCLLSTFLSMGDVVPHEDIILCGVGSLGLSCRRCLCKAAAFDIQTIGHHLS